ncbi:MAG TPA: hypothetical protein VFB79_18685 [Candidatus Angelobacter sp.]|nr:hypothetical protein [Candidatus Angelobacter sp.]
MFKVTFDFGDWEISTEVSTSREDHAANIGKAKLYSIAPELRHLLRSSEMPTPKVTRLGPKAA